MGQVRHRSATTTFARHLSWVRQPRILQPLLVGQVSKRFQPKGREEDVGSDKRIWRTAAGFARASADQVAIDQPPDQIAADLLPKNIL